MKEERLSFIEQVKYGLSIGMGRGTDIMDESDAMRKLKKWKLKKKKGWISKLKLKLKKK